MELHLKYRPKEFSEVIGQEGAVSTLENLLDNNSLPHSLLFVGPSGCGKTTLARIVARKVGCHPHDMQEKNCAIDRGIELVREIRKCLMLKPIAGDCRVWLLDECFAADTLIDTPTGSKKISELSAGDSIHSMQGVTTIEKVFINRVELSRIVRVTLSNKTIIYTTGEHLFWTNNGWVEAQHLEGESVYDYRELQILQTEVSQTSRESRTMLLEELYGKTKIQTQLDCRQSQMQGVQKAIYKDTKESPRILQQQLCSTALYEESYQTGGIIQRDSTEKIECCQVQIQQNKSRAKSNSRLKHTDEIAEPLKKSTNSSKDGSYQTPQRYFGRMETQSWRKRADKHNTAAFVENAKNTLDGKLCDTNQAQITIPNQLQSGSRDSHQEDRGRNRWVQPPMGGPTSARQEKNETTKETGVESVTFYQRGCNEQLFSSVVTDTGRSQGYVEFYDLQVAGHPSYFANGIAVHNCHQLTEPSQQSLLKMLEEAPAHVYFFLATTDPHDLLATIRTRCTDIRVAALNNAKMERLLQSVCKRAKLEVSADVIERITQTVDGSPRKALVVLHQVAHIDNEEMQLKAIEDQDYREDGIKVARALFDGSDWKKMSAILKSLKPKTDVEGLRYLILGYADTVLLNSGKYRAFEVIEAFHQPLYSSKKPGFDAICYELTALKKKKNS